MKDFPAVLAIILASTAITSAALADSYTLECQAEKVVDRKEFINNDTFFTATRSIKPERRVIVIDANGTLTYGLGDGKPQDWTLHIKKVSGKDEKLEVDTDEITDRWGYTRWVATVGDTFVTLIRYPDGTRSATGGRCRVADDAPANTELRDPGQSQVPAQKTWNVPFDKRHGSIELEGKMNNSIDVKWALDTGATITNIPYDLAKRLGAKAIREQTFALADGTAVTNQIILIKKLSIGGQVAVDDIEASVSETGTMPLLGKNFLDSFSSYEINNAQSQLILRK